jgi:hypothetical protein
VDIPQHHLWTGCSTNNEREEKDFRLMSIAVDIPQLHLQTGWGIDNERKEKDFGFASIGVKLLGIGNGELTRC